MDDLDGAGIARLTSLLSGGLLTQAVSTAALLGVADAIGHEARTSAEVANRCGTDPRATYRLLRCLCSIELVEQVDADLFVLSDAGHLLRRDHPRSLRSWAVVQGRLMAPLWAALPSAVETGEAADREVFGSPFYEHLGTRPDLAAEWDEAMAETARAWLEAPLEKALDWAEVATVVDVGGGRGGLLAAHLRRHPHLRGVLVDLPHVVSGAAPTLEAAGVAERVEVVGGDFFQHVPSGADVYLLARVVFNWDDERALRILRTCRRAMAPESRVVVVDQVLDDQDVPDPAIINDLSLLAIGGHARSFGEWNQLAAAADLAPSSPGPPPSSAGWSGWTLTARRT